MLDISFEVTGCHKLGETSGYIQFLVLYECCLVLIIIHHDDQLGNLFDALVNSFEENAEKRIVHLIVGEAFLKLINLIWIDDE